MAEPVVRSIRPKWYTHLGDFINTLKAFLGASYQAVPYAFACSGLAFGLAGVFLVATLTDHCCNLLIRCKNFLVDKICAEQVVSKNLSKNDEDELRERLQRSMGYGDVGYLVFGQWCFQLIQFAVCFTQFSICVLYFIFIGNTAAQIFPLKEVIHVPNVTEFLGSQVFHELYIPLKLESYKKDVNDETNFLALDMLEDEFISKNSNHWNNSYNHNQQNSTSLSSTSTDLATTAVSHLTTIMPTNSTISYESTAPDLRLIVLWVLPFFLCTAIVRKVRYIAPLSSIASVALGIGIVSVLSFLCSGFKPNEFEWYKFATLPLFFTQLISAYEGIGCILPIHCSMVGSRHRLPYYIHVNVFIIFVILCTFGALGYTRFGDKVEQLLVLNITQHTPLSILVDAVLIVSIMFTYPLQCFPVIEIFERYIFGAGTCCKSMQSSHASSIEVTVNSGETTPLFNNSMNVNNVGSLDNVEIAATVPTWKRNVLRIVLTLVIAGMAVGLRNYFAYVVSFTGAVGSSLLAFILPCLMDIQLRKAEMSRAALVKDICILVFAILASVSAVVCIIIQLVKKEI